MSRKPLTLEDREAIACGIAAGHEGKTIAITIGRDPSVISREISRGGGRGAYRAAAAHQAAAVHRRRPKTRRLESHPGLRHRVLAGLKRGHSPGQIAGRLRIEPVTGHTGQVTISHEAIYSWLYAKPVGELKALAEQQVRLRTSRTRRAPATGRKPRQARITGMRLIDERPAEVEDRAVPGHWEGDLVIGKNGASAAATLVERTSRLVLLVALPGKEASIVAERLFEKINAFPTHLFRSLTWDQGTEMADHAVLTLKTDMPVYFAHPHSPWERGSNEHQNRWIREYLPKSTPIPDDQDYLDAIARELNDRPRAILGYRTPSEVFTEILTSSIASTD